MIAGSPPGGARLLGQIPALSELSEQLWDDLADRCELRAFRSGAPIVAGGSNWAGAGVLLTGQARIVDERGGSPSVTIDSLSAGALFAHDSLTSGIPFPHSVYASSDSSVLLLTRETFDEWLGGHQELRQKLRRAAERRELRQFISGSPLFGTLEPDSIEKLLGSMRELRLQPGAVLMSEGDAARHVYLFRSGSLRYRVDGRERVETIERGELIGEIGVLNDQPRSATVLAESETHGYAIPGDVFRKVAGEQRRFRARVESLIAKRLGAPSPAAAEPDAQSQADAILRWTTEAFTPIQRSRMAMLRERFPRLARRVPRKFPAVRQQSQMDCGAACLATVCRYYGKRVSLNRLRELARVGAAGASMLHIKHAAQVLGFETIPILATLDHLRENHKPAIVNWQGYHWIVVYETGEDDVTVADPGRGLVRIPIDEFTKGWTRYTLYLRPTPRFGDVEESAPTLRQFAPYIRPYKRMLIEIGLASLTIQLFALLLPLLTRFVIDDVIVRQRPQWLNTALIAVSGAIVLQWALAWSRQRLVIYVARHVNLRLLGDFYNHVLKLPLPFFEKRKTGDVVSRFEENSKITTFFTTTGIDLSIDAITAVLYLALMFHFSVPLATVVSFFLVLHVGNIYLLTPYLQHGFRDVFQRGAELSSHVIETLGGLRTIRTLGIEHFIRGTWENLFARYTNAYFKTLKYGIVSGLASQLVNNAGNVVVLFYGASLVLSGQLSIGALVAFTVLFTNVTTPVTKLVGTWDNFQETINAVERLNDVYESAPESRDQPGDELAVLPTLKGRVHFEDLVFRYDADGRNVLQNVTLQVKDGQRVAFVGRSGSGKSTMVKLLLGFYRPTTGRILIDGFDLKDVWLPSLRRQIGVVPQESFLFHATIRDNITQSRPDASPAEVEWAATLANAHEFIACMPQGYETMLDEKGSNLSGGQRQRIAIARAILQRPRIIVLDEATSALDTESERRFMQNMNAAFSGRTVFMIAHRLSTVRHADLIVVLDHGNIIEQGNHEQLMERRGMYYLLATQQLNL